MEPVVALLVLSPIYFIPSIVAWARQCRRIGGVFVVNLFLGWTVLGWIGALVWASAGEGERLVKHPW